MDVLTTAWCAASGPTLNPPDVGPRRPGDRAAGCARCGRNSTSGDAGQGGDVGDLVPVRAVVSPVFTAFEGWVNPGGRGLCQVCSWGHRTPALRAGAHLVTAASTRPSRAATLISLTGAQLGAVLSAGALGPRVALVVPLRPGRKHVLPGAAWGRVSVEDAHLPWTGQDAGRLPAMGRLRAQGFTARMLTAPAPPWPVLSRLPGTWWSRVLDDWSTLAPWRVRRPWLDLGITATHPSTGTGTGKGTAADWATGTGTGTAACAASVTATATPPVPA